MRTRRVCYFFVFLLLLVGGVFIFQGKGVAPIKAWRFEKNLAAARDSLQKEDFENVARLTGAAWRLGTGEIAEVRSLFELASEVRSPDSYPLGEELFSHQSARFADRLAVLEAALERGNSLYLNSLLGRLSEDEYGHHRVSIIRVQKLLAEGNRLDAMVLLASFSKDESQLPRIQVLRSGLLAGERGNPLAWQSCRELVSGLMESGGEQALPAFRVLGMLPDEEFAKFESHNLASWIDKQPEAQSDDHLLAARWQLARGSDDQAGILEQVLDLGAEAPEQVARWLVRQGQTQAIFERGTDLEANDSFPFYLAKLQVYFNEERWEEAAAHLEKPHRSMAASLLAGFRAGVAAFLGDEVGRLSNLQEALRKAKSSENFAEYLALFRLGVRLQDEEMQQKTCEELVLLPSRFLPGGESLGFLEQQFGDDPDYLASLYQKLIAAKPDDALIIYRKALVDFVLTGEVAPSLSSLEGLSKRFPESSLIRSARAFVLVQEDPAQALDLVSGAGSEGPSRTGVFETAVKALLLRVNGHPSQADNLERQIEWSTLPTYLQVFFKQKRSQTTLSHQS